MTAIKFLVRPSFYIFWSVFCLLDSENVLPVFLLAAVLHELGHAAAVYACGGYIQRIELSAAGAVICQGKSLGYCADCAIALAGPAVGMIAAWVLSMMGYPLAAGANIMLSVFNCLPILPLDGGCALYSLIAMLPHTAAAAGHRILGYVSIFQAFLMMAFGGFLLLYTGRNATVLVTGLFLLAANRSLLHGTADYGMIKLKSYCTSIEKRWKQG